MSRTRRAPSFDNNWRAVLDPEATKMLTDVVIREGNTSAQVGTGTQLLITRLSHAAQTRWPGRDWSRQYLTANDVRELIAQGFSLHLPTHRECRELTRTIVYRIHDTSRRK